MIDLLDLHDKTGNADIPATQEFNTDILATRIQQLQESPGVDMVFRDDPRWADSNGVAQLSSLLNSTCRSMTWAREGSGCGAKTCEEHKVGRYLTLRE